MKAEKYTDWHTTDTVYVVIYAPGFNDDRLIRPDTCVSHNTELRWPCRLTYGRLYLLRSLVFGVKRGTRIIQNN